MGAFIRLLDMDTRLLHRAADMDGDGTRTRKGVLTPGARDWPLTDPAERLATAIATVQLAAQAFRQAKQDLRRALHDALVSEGR
jgi:hypothetical protein